MNYGKFEGEMDYVPYYWNLGMNSLADEDDGETFVFYPTLEDRDMFPSLKSVSVLRLVEDENGFIHCRAE